MSGAQKYYKLHWLTGQVEIIHGGNSISEAFAIAGYGGGAIRALDWYEECAENAKERRKTVRAKRPVQQRKVVMPKDCYACKYRLGCEWGHNSDPCRKLWARTTVA